MQLNNLLACGTVVRVTGYNKRTATIVGYEAIGGIVYYFVEFDDFICQFYQYTTIRVHYSEVQLIK